MKLFTPVDLENAIKERDDAIDDLSLNLMLNLMSEVKPVFEQWLTNFISSDSLSDEKKRDFVKRLSLNLEVFLYHVTVTIRDFKTQEQAVDIDQFERYLHVREKLSDAEYVFDDLKTLVDEIPGSFKSENKEYCKNHLKKILDAWN